MIMLILLWLTAVTVVASLVPPGCQDRCGDVNITYPFGIGSPNCYKDEEFKINCKDSLTPPRPFLAKIDIEVLEISMTFGLVYIAGPIASACQDSGAALASGPTNYSTWVRLDEDSPYTFSPTHNRLTAIGCSTTAIISAAAASSDMLSSTSGCMTICGPNVSMMNGSCSGIGCCQASIPKGQKSFLIGVTGSYNSSSWDDSDDAVCSYAFLVDPERFSFYTSDVSGRSFMNRSERIPVALEWSVGDEGCEDARKESSVVCGKNSYCSQPPNGDGYLCRCYDGFEGNPYLPDGCDDVDECEDPAKNPCISLSACKNSAGSYCCQCPFGTTGDGRKNGSGCTPLLFASDGDFPAIKVALGCGSGFLLLLLGISWLYWGLRKRKIIKLREKFFEQNGGYLLQQQLSSRDPTLEAPKIFTADELRRATNNYHESRILGKGGYGTVYKGILPDNRVVAIKKSKLVDESQVEQFINELVILSQINHKHVVKLLGCCLEAQVPMLVYEFVTNGTLFDQIHNTQHGETGSFLWENRLRVAAETANALAYLHSAASVPIIHRDIKSTNILLDENYTAKVSDFGASRLVPLDHSQLTTLVQGTLGYLDPEYFHTSQLSEKSDVYSFGVVLVELLSGKMPLCLERCERERNLAMYFVSYVKENRLVEVLEERVAREGRVEEVEGVAELARRCLKLRGEDRPTMKEVAMELEALRRSGSSHRWRMVGGGEEVEEESRRLLGEVPGFDTGDSSALDSLMNHIMLPLDTR